MIFVGEVAKVSGLANGLSWQDAFMQNGAKWKESFW